MGRSSELPLSLSNKLPVSFTKFSIVRLGKNVNINIKIYSVIFWSLIFWSQMQVSRTNCILQECFREAVIQWRRRILYWSYCNPRYQERCKNCQWRNLWTSPCCYQSRFFWWSTWCSKPDRIWSDRICIQWDTWKYPESKSRIPGR